MAISSASAMLEAWERGVGQGPTQRGLTLLALAAPEADVQSLETLSIGERDRRLMMLRECWFGPKMTGLISCPGCRTELELELATTDLRAIASREEPDSAVHGHSHDIRLRMPDSRDLIAAEGLDLTDATRSLLRACVVSAAVDGVPIEPEKLPPHLVALCARRLSDIDPLADLRLKLSCAACGRNWQAPFDIVLFLWKELDAWSRRILLEIDALARAYGWSEHEILSLSPRRRRSYLQMVEA